MITAVLFQEHKNPKLRTVLRASRSIQEVQFPLEVITSALTEVTYLVQIQSFLPRWRSGRRIWPTTRLRWWERLWSSWTGPQKSVVFGNATWETWSATPWSVFDSRVLHYIQNIVNGRFQRRSVVWKVPLRRLLEWILDSVEPLEATHEMSLLQICMNFYRFVWFSQNLVRFLT